MKNGIKKKTCAALLAALLLLPAAGLLSMTARAAEAPHSLTWTGPGQLSFYSPNGGDTRYFIEVFCDGTRVTHYDAGVCIEGTVGRDVRFVMDRAGTYTFRVKAAEYEGDTDFSHGAVSEFSEGYWLAPAGNALPQPADLRWSDTKGGLAVWSGVEGAAKYHVVLYDNGTPVKGILTFDSMYTQEALAPYMTGGEGHTYTFSVMAVSPDPGQTANSALSYSDGRSSSPADEPTVPVPAPPAVPDTRVPFPDVYQGRYYTDAVAWAYEAGIMNGYEDGRFGVDDVCTRAQIVTTLHRAMGGPAPVTTVNVFADVTEADYFLYPVMWATETGITKGREEGYFAPADPCTRAQIVTFLWRANGSPASFPDGTAFWHPFADLEEDAYYVTAAAWARANEFTQGHGDEHTFAPDVPCTRAQIATFLYRMFGGGK